MRTIGEGEFGKVKLAVHSETGAEVAIKLCKKSQVVATPNGYTKLMREISTLKLVKHHPFIITLIEVIETEAYIAIVMELAKGGELFEHILAKRSLGEQETRKLFAQIISAVGYIHSLGIVHRDLKLENILLDENQDVVLIDFGFANKTRGPNVMMRTSCGSPCYAAPELVTSDGYIGEKADLWSCGVILFSMIAGYLPWDDDPNNPEGDNINMLYNYIMNTPLDYPDHVPYECRLLINRILEPNPDKRADIDEIINHVWLKPIKHIFDIEMDRRMSLTGSLSSQNPAKVASGSTDQQVPAILMDAEFPGPPPAPPRSRKPSAAATSPIQVIEPVASTVPASTPGNKQTIESVNSVHVVPASAAPSIPIPTLAIPTAPNPRPISMVVETSTERSISEAETVFVVNGNADEDSNSSPAAMVSDRMVVDEPTSFTPSDLRPPPSVHVIDSFITATNDDTDSNQPSNTPPLKKEDPEEDTTPQLTDLRGLLTTLSNASTKSLPTTPEVSPLLPTKPTSDNSNNTHTLDWTHPNPNHPSQLHTQESIELRPSSFAEFMWKAMNRPLPELPPVESDEPRGILRGGFSAPLGGAGAGGDISRGSSTTKKRVSILEPAVSMQSVAAQQQQQEQRKSWLLNLTNKFFGAGGAGGEEGGRGATPVAGQSGSDLLSRRNSLPPPQPVSPTPGIQDFERELPPVPPAYNQSTAQLESRRSKNLLSGFFGGLVTTPRASSPSRRQDSNQSNLSRAQTPLSWYATSRPSTPLTSRDPTQIGASTTTTIPPPPDMTRSQTALSLSGSDYHVQFSNRSRGGGSTSSRQSMHRTRKMRMHVGYADVRAISRRDPETLLEDIQSMLEQRGFEVLPSGGSLEFAEFRLKVVKPGMLSKVPSGGNAAAGGEGVLVSVAELKTFMELPDQLLDSQDDGVSMTLSPMMARTIAKNEKVKQGSKFIPASLLKKVR
ncbi:hypothetical protein HDU99_007190, partial [Rhizoclosmatium hyalinum]